MSRAYMPSLGQVPEEYLYALFQDFEKLGIQEFSTVAIPFDGDNKTYGPAVNPHADDGDLIKVTFGQVCVSLQKPQLNDEIMLEGFDKLCAPAVYVDLQACIHLALRLMQSLVFFFSPYDYHHQSPIFFSGREAQLDYQQGKLRFIWEDACHRDVVGVFFHGNRLLVAEDSVGDLRRELGDSPFLAAAYLGEHFWADKEISKNVGFQEKMREFE